MGFSFLVDGAGFTSALSVPGQLYDPRTQRDHGNYVSGTLAAGEIGDLRLSFDVHERSIASFRDAYLGISGQRDVVHRCMGLQSGVYGGQVTVYAIAQLTIHDRARYQRYVAAFLPILSRYGGRLLAADEHPEVTEGQWAGDKVVLLTFQDREKFTAWITSLEYQQIAGDRLAAAQTTGILVRGLS